MASSGGLAGPPPPLSVAQCPSGEWGQGGGGTGWALLWSLKLRDSRPRVQKRKPKLGWGEGGASRIQISGQGAGPQSLQCLSSISPSLGLSATLCSVPEAQPLLMCPGTVQRGECWRAGPGERTSTAGTRHWSRWTRDSPGRTGGRREDIPV